MPGPPMFAAARLISSFELPSTTCSRPTSAGRYDWYATSKKTVPMPVNERDRVQLPDRERVEPVARPGRVISVSARAEVGEDQDRTTPQPVDPDAGRQREEKERQELDGREQRDPERRLLEGEDRDERQCQERDLRPELADRLRAPQRQKVAVPPETPGPPHVRLRRPRPG